MTPSPSLSPLASLLLSLAHIVAPKKDKLWIGDMRLEAAFASNKLQFALSALGLACKFRWEAIRQNRTATLAFASTALAALAVLLFVPRMFNNPPTANGSMSAPSSYEETSAYLEDVAAQRGISADAQEPQAEETVVPQTSETAPQANTTTAEAVIQEAVAEVPAVPNAPEPLAAVPPPAAITPAPTESAADVASATLSQESATELSTPTEPSVDAAASPVESSSESSIETTPPESESASNQAATPDTLSEASEDDETGTQAKVAAMPTPITPSADTIVLSTQVKGDSVTLESTSEALLTLYRNSDFAGSPRIHRYLEAGETLTFGIPFSLYTDDASAITVTVDGSSFALSEDNEEQFRIFTKP